ncbi:MAG: hypothetical protein ABIE70_11045 [bacterium]
MKHTLVFTCFLVAMLLMVGCDREITGNVPQPQPSSSNCFDCHDYGTDFGSEVKAAMGQYANSQHASGNAMRTGSCGGCHTTEGFIESVTGEEFPSGAANAVGCFACHDPHENGDFRLRTTAAVELGNGAMFDRNEANLCVACHHGRRDVRTYVADGVKLSSHFGPHHNCQGDMLIGENAYEYAGYSYSQNSWHATGVTDGCIKCHFDVSDAYNVGGHTFWMEAGESENTAACNVAGCHVNDTEIDDFDRVTAYDFDDDGDNTEGAQTEINDLMHELETALIAAGLLEWVEDAQAWEPTNGLTVSDADSVGAVFNWAFVHEDKSHGIHNTRYAAALLISSINYMTTGNPNGAPQDPDDSDSRTARLASARMMPAH